MENLFKMLPGLLKSFPDSPEVREAVVFAVWKRAAGEGLSEQTIPKAVENSRLCILVRDNIWKKHLESMAPKLLYRLNTLLESGEIKFLDFRIEAAAFPEVSDDENQGNIVDSSIGFELPVELIERAQRIKDKKLRQRFLDSATVYLKMRDIRSRR